MFIDVKVPVITDDDSFCCGRSFRIHARQSLVNAIIILPQNPFTLAATCFTRHITAIVLLVQATPSRNATQACLPMPSPSSGILASSTVAKGQTALCDFKSLLCFVLSSRFLSPTLTNLGRQEGTGQSGDIRQTSSHAGSTSGASRDKTGLPVSGQQCLRRLASKQTDSYVNFRTFSQIRSMSFLET